MFLKVFIRVLFRLFMRTFSICTLNDYFRGLNRQEALKLLMFRWDIVFHCSSLLAIESSVSEDSSDENFLSPTHRVSSKMWVQNGYCVNEKKIGNFVTKISSNLGKWRRKEDDIKRVGSILSNRGWDLGFLGELVIDLDDSTMVVMLNDLFNDSSDAALAFFFFMWVEGSNRSKHGVRSICTMIHILIIGKMNYIAMDLLRYLITSNDGDEYWQNLIFNTIKETCEDRVVLETMYSMLVSSCVEENMTGLAMRFMEQMKPCNFFPSMGVYNTFLRVLLKSKQTELAWDMLQEMFNNGIGLNATLVSLFIHEYCAEGSFVCASKLLFEMRNYGCEADIVSYTILMDALCKKGLLKEATTLLYKIIQMGLSVDSVSVTSLIDSYCKLGMLVEAVNILEVSGCGPNVFMYNSFISKLCKDGNMVEAARLFAEMAELGISPDCYSYTTVIRGFCKVSEINNAIKLFCELLKRGIRPSVITYTVLIDGFCKRGDLEEADYMFSIIRKEGIKPDVVMYNGIINGYSKKGLLHKAFKCFTLMQNDSCDPDITTYNILIHGLLKRGFLKESKEILEELVRRGFSPDEFTFTNAIETASKEGSFQEAYLIWCHMSENGMQPDVVTCSALLNAYCKAQQMEEGEALFHQMLEAGLEPDLILYNTLINGFCRGGRIWDACKLLNMMAKQGITPNSVTYRALVHGFCINGIENAANNAALKIQTILMENGIEVDKSQLAFMFDLAVEGTFSRKVESVV